MSRDEGSVREARRSGWPVVVAALLLLGYVLSVAADVLLHASQYQWDFQTYYYAGAAYAQGLNPYDLGDLSAAAGREIGFPFVYTPVTLPVFRLLSLLEYRWAYGLYFVLKLAALAGLVYFWERRILQGEGGPLFWALCVLGFGGALYADLTSGNITVFEQLALWCAFWSLLRSRAWVFCLLVGVVSLFKLTPVAFLAFLLLPDLPKKKWYALGTAAALAAILGLSYFVQRDLFASFLSVARSLDERGLNNPASLALIRDGIEFVSDHALRLPVSMAEALVFGLFALLVLLLTGLAVRRLPKTERWMAVFLGCLAFALIMPRFKNYSYLLLIVPAYAVVRRQRTAQSAAWILVLLMLSSRLPVPFGLGPALDRLVWNYYPLLGAFFVWLLGISAALRGFRLEDGQAGGGVGKSPSGMPAFPGGRG